MLKTEKIFSISEYLNFLNQGFRNFKAKIIGEVSEVNFGPSGHCFFKLKDKKDGSLIECLIYKSRYELFGLEIKEGVKLIADGCPRMHPTYGFSFIAETIEYSGKGSLKEQYEKLKKKLAEEGLFAEERKRPLPRFPQKIGIITSKAGSVLADFLNNLGRFGFRIKMIDSRVEGQAAVADLLLSIKTFKNKDIDLLVIARGGGSLESLIAFNNELLVKEVAGFPVPVIAAIGHDKDIPLVSLAADLEVSTPSIAATTINASWERAVLLAEQNRKDILNSYSNILMEAEGRIAQSIDKIFLRFKTMIAEANNDLRNKAKIIYQSSPERQMKLGYSVVKIKDRVVKSVGDVAKGDDVDIMVSDGTIYSRIKALNKNKQE